MKTSLRYFLSFTTYFLMFASSNLQAQNNQLAASWATKFGFQKSFIENKGQFIIPTSFGNPSQVLYAVDHGGTKIYFTKKGITYAFLEATKKPKDQKEIERERREEFGSPEEHLRHEKEEHELKTKADQITMLWQNANPNVEIEADYVTSDYHNYYFKQTNGEYKNVSYIKGYKKITYKNLYPNIDVDYMFSEKGGLKYSLTLHPGADPSLVKMVYDNHVSLNNNGEIRINTKFGDIIDHAPLTFYGQNSSSVITSSFVKTGKTVSFQLGNYDNTKTVVIDPWTQTPAFTSNWDCVWECENDAAGNVYIIGGVMPLQLIKYNSTGAIQWTYNTPYDTTSWLGTFATDDVGNSYVTNGTTPGIIKVNTAGILQWTTGGGALAEYWNIAFNCDQTKLITGGTDNLRGAIFDINTTNGALLSSKIVAYGAVFGIPPSIQEVRSITPCGNGKYYFLTLDSIGYINQNLTSCNNNAGLFKTTSTHGFSYKCENYRYDNTGIMAIRADLNFVYTHNGTTLFKRSLANAAIIASVPIPGGASTSSLGKSLASCSGIDIDAAGNIYVGSTNAVTKFSSGLVQLGTVAVPFNVYDVHVSTAGDVIACGSTGNSGTSSRTGYIQSIASLTAGSMLALTCCDANICQPANQCLTNPAFNLQASTAGGTWSGTGITNATTGTFNPATAGIGTHVITYSLACGVGTTTIVVTACGTVSLCVNSGSLVASGGAGTYTWSSTTTSVSCAACPGGNCIPFICAGTTVPTWTASGSTVASPSSTVFPIRVKDIASGVTFTFTTLASIPACSVTVCPTLTMAVSSQTNVNCFGASTGTANVSTSGGSGPYTYTWSPGALSGASQTGLSAGTYTMAIRDANNCVGTGTVVITQPTSSLSAVISATTITGCGASTGGATVTASGGTPGYTYSWTPSGGTTLGVTNLASGNNTVTVTDSKGCVRTAIANITTAGGPTLSVTSQTNVNCFGANTGTATVNASGGTGPYTYTWSPGNLNGASQNALAAGTYTINSTDANLCTGTMTLNVTQPTAAISAIITSTTLTGCGATTGGATVTASGGTPGYTYNWLPSGGITVGVSNLGSGSNSVTVTDSKGCAVTAIANITTAGGPTLSVTSQTNINCFGASTGTATVSGSGGTGPYTYTWNPGNLIGSSQTALSAGIYTVNVADAFLCAGSGTVFITQPTTSLSAVISATAAAGCGTSTGGATVTANGGTPGYTYSWTPSGSTGSGATGLGAGNNTVIVTDSKGCTVNAVAIVTVISIADVTIIPSSTIIPCFSGSVSLTANSSTGGPYTYVWSPSAPSFTGSTFVASNSGIYTVVAINTVNSCTASATQNITVESITASFVANPTQGFVPLPVTFTNTSINPSGTTYNWNFGNTTTSTTSASTVSTIFDTQGSFPVTLIATNGSCKDTAIIYIKVELLSSIIVPNVFTPNNDGSNDIFTLKAINIGEINITIFDRWGLKMVEITDTGNIKWDGKTANGKPVTDGTYFYVLKAEGLDGKQYDLNGSINVFK